jgi:rubredoxin
LYTRYNSGRYVSMPRLAPQEKKSTLMVLSLYKEETMDKYICTICNYVYDPELGDPENNIDPGTPFENLPDSWVCPICAAEKSFFEKE